MVVVPATLAAVLFLPLPLPSILISGASSAPIRAVRTTEAEATLGRARPTARRAGRISFKAVLRSGSRSLTPP
jgi:hypothetical protein